jgi:GT2 family glycosyltransferase
MGYHAVQLPVKPVETSEATRFFHHAVKSTPKVSVIIVNYNGREYLEACLLSVLAEEKIDLEVILVDNDSQDGSADYVEQTFPQVRVIRNEINGGFSQGNNVGARKARGEYLAFLNPDTVVDPGWLTPLIAALEADPRARLATPKIMQLRDEQRINTCGNQIHFTGLTLCRGLGMDESNFSYPEEVDAVSGAAFVIRKQDFKKLGGLDERFFLYMEDTDLSVRARLAGYKCVYVPTSIVYHDYTLYFGPLKTFYQERNRYLMLLKGLRWRTLLVLLPALFMAEVVTWGFTILRDRRRFLNKLRAYIWILKHWREIVDSRRHVQAMRGVPDRVLISRYTHRLDFAQTGPGMVARVAHLGFDLPFLTLHRLAMAIIRW